MFVCDYCDIYKEVPLRAHCRFHNYDLFDVTTSVCFNFRPLRKKRIMKNIFENAYFGKPYRTRDGRKARFVINMGEHYGHPYRLVIEGEDNFFNYDEHGMMADIERGFDIVPEWQEEISEEEQDRTNCPYVAEGSGVVDCSSCSMFSWPERASQNNTKKNVFEGAYFGKPFETVGGRRVIFHYESDYAYICIVEGEKALMAYGSDGHLIYPDIPELVIKEKP